MTIHGLWGKTNPPESLIDHMKKVGDAAVRILKDSQYDTILPAMCAWSGLAEEDLISAVRYIAAMHDIGKATPSFQIKNGSSLPAEYGGIIDTAYRHEKAVPQIAPIIWPDWDGKTRRTIASVLRLHHQGRIGSDFIPSDDNWKLIWTNIEKEIRDWASFTNISVRDFPDVDSFCTILTGLVILSDWIASSGNTDVAFDALDLRHKRSLESFDFAEKFGCSPRTLQFETIKEFEQLKEMPLFTVVEAPPGEGKTELAVWLAHKLGQYWNKNGIYFALPTAATSNQMVMRMKHFFGEKVALIHGTSWLKEDTTGIDEEWKRPQKRGLLARFAVGTVDQVMMSVLRTRFGVLRLFGLMNKVVVIDEIHSYDAYMTEIITRLLEWCRALKIPVIMLSATLPSERKKTLLGVENPEQAYPLITTVFEDDSVKQFTASDVHRHMTTNIKLVKGFSNVDLPKSGVGCVMANTVDRAREIYESLEGPKMLIHGAFTAELKDQLENRVLECCGPNGKREHMTIVSTQILEQSLDIDFDWLITEIAPIDLLIQRLGRLHRFDIPAREPAECQVFIDSGIAGNTYGKSGIVYFDLLLQKTQALLSERNSISMPDDIRELVEQVYSDMGSSDDLEAFLSYSSETRMQTVAAKASVISAPHASSFGLQTGSGLMDDDEHAATTRLGDSYKICILPEKLHNEIADRIGNEQFIPAALAAEAIRYSASTSKKYSGLKGTGKLAGYIIRKGSAESPTETSVSDGSEYEEKLMMDKEKGLCLM